MNKEIGQSQLWITVVLALFSGIIGSVLSPIFQEKLANEEFRVNQVKEIATNLQEAHMEMSLQAWRLTIASKATPSELNSIHDSWLFSYRETTKWLEVLKDYFQNDSQINSCSKSINKFYNLEVNELGLSDSTNKPKGQKLIADFENRFIELRRHVFGSTKVSIW